MIEMFTFLRRLPSPVSFLAFPPAGPPPPFEGLAVTPGPHWNIRRHDAGDAVAWSVELVRPTGKVYTRTEGAAPDESLAQTAIYEAKDRIWRLYTATRKEEMAATGGTH